MQEELTCCGIDCSKCEHYPKECKGCNKEKGKVFWTEYTGEEICNIYACCIKEKDFRHCGLCENMPCERFHAEDPTKSAEENAEEHRKQVENLTAWKYGKIM